MTSKQAAAVACQILPYLQLMPISYVDGCLLGCRAV
jgi:hypothetical protein